MLVEYKLCLLITLTFIIQASVCYKTETDTKVILYLHGPFDWTEKSGV